VHICNFISDLIISQEQLSDFLWIKLWQYRTNSWHFNQGLLGNFNKIAQLDAFMRAVCTVSPTGKQNSFASRVYASYVLAEKGDDQPRSLAQAFLDPVRGYADQGVFTSAVNVLNQYHKNFNQVYGNWAGATAEFNVEKGKGSLDDIISFVVS